MRSGNARLTSRFALTLAIGLVLALVCAPAAFAAQGSVEFTGLSAGTVQTQADDGYVYSNDYWRVYYEGGKAAIVEYLGSDPNVTIPSSVDLDNDGTSYPVVGVDENAFAGKNITSVYVPPSVNFIDANAFANCTSLQSVTGCAGLTYIGKRAFSGCSQLASFPFGKKLEFIGVDAFKGTKISTAKYPKTLADDGTGNFRPCTAMLYIKGKENYKYAYQVLTKVNKERKKHGLGALTMDKDLMKAAMQRAAEISLVFDHVRPNATTCFTVCEDKMSGENIAGGQTSPSSAMSSWMNSPGHRANILNKSFKSIGVGCMKVNGRYLWVQTFGYGNAAKASKPGNKTVTHAVVYNRQGGKLKFKMKAVKVKKGKKKAVKIVCTNSFARVTIQPKSFSFSSSKAKVASVSSGGKVKGKKHGKAKITAKVKRGTLKVSGSVKVS